jgi:ABC-type anion transport system duplicated permease subunit
MDFINQVQDLLPVAVIQIAAIVLGILFLVFLTLTIVLAVKNRRKKVKLVSAIQVNKDIMMISNQQEKTVIELKKNWDILNRANSSLSADYRELNNKYESAKVECDYERDKYNNEKERYSVLLRERSYMEKMNSGTIAKLRKDLCDLKASVVGNKKTFWITIPGMIKQLKVMADSIYAGGNAEIYLQQDSVNGKPSRFVAILPANSTVICEKNIVREPANQVNA